MWICTFVLAGYFFGSIPVVQQNFGLVIYVIMGISLLAVASIIIKVFWPGRQDGAEKTDKPEKE